MDDMTVREFLSQLGPQYERYAEYFHKHQFTDVASLRCLEIPGDVSYIFGDVLSLFEKRRIECALREIKNVQKDDKIPMSVSSRREYDDHDEKQSSALHKISWKIQEQIKDKKLQLIDAEEQLQQLEMPIEEPQAQGSLNYRCTNCHIKGHKADGNKGSSSICQNDKCTDYLLCGQKEKHKEYREEKKRLQNKIKSVKDDISGLNLEKSQTVAFSERNDSSFVKIMKERLRRTDPKKYTNPSKLMSDLMRLKTVYKGKVPSVSQNDRFEFPKQLNNINEEIKSEFNFKREKSDPESESDDDRAFVPSKRQRKDICNPDTTNLQVQPPFMQQPAQFFNPFMGQFQSPYMYSSPYVPPNVFPQPAYEAMHHQQQFGYNQQCAYPQYGFIQQPPFPFSYPPNAGSQQMIPLESEGDITNRNTQCAKKDVKPKLWSPI